MVLTPAQNQLQKSSTLELNKIYCGKAEELLPKIDDGFVDLILTDPPYGIDLDYGYKDDWRPNRKIWRDCYRVLKNNSFLIMTSSNKHLPFWIDELRMVKFNYAHCGVYWNKCRAGGNYSGLFAYAWEPILFFFKGLNTPKLTNRMLSDVFSHIGVKETNHPAERDISVWRKILNLFDANLVLDPFIGSGTTAVACKQLNRNFIGFEINPKYVEIANRRLSQRGITDFVRGV